ncbi:MAG TPA: S46 family peptidase, partial [Burkholderiaceae bacterium]
MISIKSLAFPLALLSAANFASADEGQWQPHQLPQLKAELKRIGIAIPAEKLADLTKHPMSAIVSLGGCSASFVSPDGLVVTNHHCGYSAIQRNSTAQKNFIRDGFLAKTRADELPAGPNERILVTDKLDNVTRQVKAGLLDSMSGAQRREHIQRNIKALVAECEKDKAYRCSVPSFHRGLEYYRIRQMQIRDVRLVYAPAEGIGNFGGDTDNYEFPRHTGDFTFLRAYVGKDGKPADPSPDNVPYKSKDFLVVSSQGLKNGDPVLVVGYPGVTSRYKLPVEVRAANDTIYPQRAANLKADIDLINSFRDASADYNVRYASTEKGMHNVMKKTRGQLDAFARSDVVGIRSAQDAEFRAWLAKQPDSA